MSTSASTVAAGNTSTPAPLLLGQSLTATPQVQGGTVLIQTGPTQNGPWFPAAGGSSTSAISVTPNRNLYYTVTATTQAATVAVSDIAIPNMRGEMIDINVPCDSPNSTSESAVYSFRIPANTLPANFAIKVIGALRMTNNANAKTMQVRMNGVAGTLAFQSPALASNANYNFVAQFSGAGDNATLKGFGAGSAGGFGLSTTAYTSLSYAYQTTEIEIVVTVTKATGTDTMALDSLVVQIY